MHSRFLIMVCECGLSKPCRKISLPDPDLLTSLHATRLSLLENVIPTPSQNIVDDPSMAGSALGVRGSNDRLSGSIAPGSVLLKRTDAFGRARIHSFQTIDRTAYLRRDLAQIANDHKS